MNNCIGIDISCFLKSWEDSISQPLSTIKNLGYDIVELPINGPFSFDYNTIGSQVNKNSLRCSCGTGLTGENNIFSPFDTTVENGITFLKKAIDVTQQLGSNTLGGVIFAPWGQVGSREGTELCYKNAINSLHILGNYAKKKNVTLCIEVINRYESSYINTLEEARNIVDKIDCENVKAHFDSYHANIEEKNIAQAILDSKNYIGHVHFSDNDRGYPGSGHINFQEIIKSLKQIDYQGNIVMECFVTPKCDVGNDTYTWRNIDSCTLETASKAIENVQKWLKEQN